MVFSPISIGKCANRKICKISTFLSSIHMPTTLEELHIADKSYEDLVRVGERALEPNDTLQI